MTTSDLRSGLRRALMTLEKSLHSNDGLPPSPIDDLNTPEERLASRLVERLQLRPAVDVLEIASSLATVTLKDFPQEIDGLCLDLKQPGKRPKIWLSKRLGRIRRRFTLAHEIGHIIIPWHTGSIVDDLEAPRSTARGLYRQMEAEANRFAAELLMPSSWVRGLSERAEHAADVMHTIVRRAEVSFPAALFRVEKLGPPGYVAAEIRDRVIVWSGRTKGTWSIAPQVGTRLDVLDMPVAHEPRVISNEDSRYFWWKMREEVDAPELPAGPWRDILEGILHSIPVEHRHLTRQRVNAIIGYAIGVVPKGTSVEQIYRRGLEASQNRSDRDRWLAAVIRHPEFKDYVLARAYDRSKSR